MRPICFDDLTRRAFKILAELMQFLESIKGIKRSGYLKVVMLQRQKEPQFASAVQSQLGAEADLLFSVNVPLNVPVSMPTVLPLQPV